jgi:hypothetical protein
MFGVPILSKCGCDLFLDLTEHPLKILYQFLKCALSSLFHAYLQKFIYKSKLCEEMSMWVDDDLGEGFCQCKLKFLSYTITQDLSMICCNTLIKETHKKNMEGWGSFWSGRSQQLGVSLLAASISPSSWSKNRQSISLPVCVYTYGHNFHESFTVQELGTHGGGVTASLAAWVERGNQLMV